MEFNIVADGIIKGKAYPALAQWSAEPYTQAWREFSQHWPNTVPVNLHEHCQEHGLNTNIHTIDNYPKNSYYTIGICWFDFSIDYFKLLPRPVLAKLQENQLRVLFYYDEGDNPHRIKQHLDMLCQKNRLPVNCYRFISANTQADAIPGFAYLPCDELLYWQRNQTVVPARAHGNQRERNFTVLNRTHKWWRATVMADLNRHNLLDNSYWSYRVDVDCDDNPADNPIEIDRFENLRKDIDYFLAGAPYTCDDLTSDEHNDHTRTELDHYTNSYCSIVLETHFDADRSGGTFLTEKTFKCLKHAHPFILVAPPKSLENLRELGYQTFDHAIDNRYDTIVNNTDRWIAIKHAVNQLKQQDLHTWYNSIQDDILHNQQLFLSSKQDRLNKLFKRLSQYD